MPTGAVVESIPAVYKNSVITMTAGKQAGVFYRIKRINAKSLVVTDVTGHEWRFDTSAPGAWKFIREATESERDAFTTEELSQVVFYRVGNIVHWPSCTHALGKGKLLVVTKVNADGDCNLVPLGGVLTLEFFRSVPSRLLEKVDGDVTVTNA
jgi:hypothetical protein